MTKRRHNVASAMEFQAILRPIQGALVVDYDDESDAKCKRIKHPDVSVRIPSLCNALLAAVGPQLKCA
ncbi:hypothetical protein [Mesorhizobium loti]|uniref:hypothetical protein n=1 Tax=Rhizobium loti TaxID=381 RepID=UPI0012692F39|nr:hypothetical protein [Mesorhizobium loti]